MCLHVFYTKLLWYFEAFHGLFYNLCGALAYQNLLIWKRGTEIQPIHMDGTRDQGRRKGSVISTLHNPYLKTRWGHTSTSEPSCQQPIQTLPPLTAPSHWKQAKGTLHPTGIGGFLSLYTQLVVSAINQHSQGITGAIFSAAVWPDVWPRCDCSLG